MNELSKGFTGIEVNGVRFSNVGEMLHYMDRQREQLIKAKDILRRLMASQPTPSSMYEEADLADWREVNKEAEKFLKDA